MRRTVIAVLWAALGLPLAAQFPGPDVAPQLKVHQVKLILPITPFVLIYNIETDLFLTRGGAFFFDQVTRTFRVDAWETPASTVALGVAPFPLLAALNQDLAASHVATLHGPCRADFLRPGEMIVVSWYGRHHLATHLVISPDPTLPACPADVIAVTDAALRFQDAALADPSTRTFTSP